MLELQVSGGDDLPQDILDQLAEDNESAEVQKSEQLQAIGKAIAEKRDAAVKGRLASGIEIIWQRCEDAQNGVDDANRHEFQRTQFAKPLTLEGPVMSEGPVAPAGPGKPTIYPSITSRYVHAGHSKVSEILISPDDKSFSIKPTPVPDLIDAKENESTIPGPNGQPLLRDPKPEEMAGLTPPPLSPSAAPVPPAPAVGVPSAVVGATGAPPMPGMDPAQAPGVPLKVKDLAEEQMAEATKKAEKAEKRVYDWRIEGRYRRETRKVLFDCAKLGVGILKGPYPMVRRKRAAKFVRLPGSARGMWQITMVEKIVPGYKRVRPWDFFPDPNCGEDPSEGDYDFERDRISGRSLRKLKREPGYLTDQIDKVLKEGPQKKYETNRPDTFLVDNEQFEPWYFQGMLERKDFALLNPTQAKDLKDDQEMVFVEATLVNETVIKAVMHGLEASEEFNYHVVPWTRRDGFWAGIGIAEQGYPAQRIVTSATRALIENAGHSSGPQVVMHTGVVDPSDGVWELKPWKIWFVGSDAQIDDVRKAFTSVEFPDRQAALQAIIDYGLKLFEELTNIPLITQGQSGPTSPDTYGQAQLQDNNANQLLRNVAYTFDDCVNEPLTNQEYEWLLLDPDVPDDEKGDFEIDARGSIVLVERSIQAQWIAQQAAIVKDPAFGVDPRKWYAEFARANKMDPKRLQYDDAKQQQIDSQPPPKAPQVQAAEIRAQTDLQRAQVDTDRDTAFIQAETERTRVEHEVRTKELEMKIQLAMLDYSNKRGIALEQTKSELAQTAMKLKTQERLAAQDRAGEALTPPTEPAGRAPAGQSFER